MCTYMYFFYYIEKFVPSNTSMYSSVQAVNETVMFISITSIRTWIMSEFDDVEINHVQDSSLNLQHEEIQWHRYQHCTHNEDKLSNIIYIYWQLTTYTDYINMTHMALTISQFYNCIGRDVFTCKSRMYHKRNYKYKRFISSYFEVGEKVRQILTVYFYMHNKL